MTKELIIKRVKRVLAEQARARCSALSVQLGCTTEAWPGILSASTLPQLLYNVISVVRHSPALSTSKNTRDRLME